MIAALLLACTGDGPRPSVRRVEVVEREPLREHLLDPPVDGALPAGAGVLSVAGGVRSMTTADGERFDVGAGGLPDDVADAAGQVYALADGVVVVWLGELLADAGLSGVLPGEPAGLVADGASLWVRTSEGVFRWQGGALSELQVDGESVEGVVAPGAIALGDEPARPTVWVADGDQLHGFSVDGDALDGVETHHFAAPVDAALVTDGVLLVVEGGRLWSRSGSTWQRIDGGEDVLDVFGGPSGAWLSTTGGLRLWRPDAWWAPRGLGDAEAWGSDDLGRLLLPTDGGLDRVVLHRPLRVEGLAPGDHLDTARTVELLPTAPDAVRELRARVVPQQGSPIALEVDQLATVLDPEQLPSGPATLHVTATYDGQTAELEVPFTIELVGDVTWSTHVEPIHATRCARCHASSPSTTLDGPESWEATIDPIVENIRSGSMPLTGEPLTTAQIELVEAWRDGGFLP